MSKFTLMLPDGREIPIGSGAVPICGFDLAGNSVPLVLDGSGLPALPTGAATEATLKMALGLGDKKYVTGTSANTDGPWYVILALEDTVFSSITDTKSSGATLSSVPLLAGTPYPGNITAFTLASGKVLAFKVPTT